VFAHLRSLPSRLTSPSPRTVDLLMVAGVLIGGVIEMSVVADDVTTLALGLAATVVVAVAIGLRRHKPLLALVLGFGTISLGQQDEVLYDANVPFLCLLILPYAVARYTEGRQWRYGFVLLAVMVLIGLGTSPEGVKPGDLLFGAVVLLTAPCIAGRAVRNRVALAKALREKAERLERERAAAAEAAVLDERTRIAGELHDVVSHALSAMTVQASLVRRLGDKDPAAARAAFGAVEQTGRDALTELRRMLGVLRREDEEIALAPQPSLAHVRELVQRIARAGLPVDLDVQGEPPAALPAGVDLTAYRLIQTALSTAREGDAGRATVQVNYLPAGLEVVVSDDGRAPIERTLLGLRERVQLYGGEMQAARLLEGGHMVRAWMPLEAT
jgi:signal transduction histidine kinase